LANTTSSEGRRCTFELWMLYLWVMDVVQEPCVLSKMSTFLFLLKHRFILYKMFNQSFLIPVFSLFDNKKCKLVPTCNTFRARDVKNKMFFLLLRHTPSRRWRLRTVAWVGIYKNIYINFIKWNKVKSKVWIKQNKKFNLRFYL
jgi:hypothetical protein